MSYISNTLKTTILLALLTGLTLWIGNFFGGATGLFIAFAIVLLFNGLMYWFSDKIVLWMYRAKPLAKGHHAYRLVHEVARRAELPEMPQVYIVENETPNAFATGRSPRHSAVAVTTGILKLLDDKELEGVIAHEISHIKNRDTLIQTIAGVLAGVISYIASMVRWGAMFGSGSDEDNGGGILGLIIIGILAPIIALILQMAISRSREYLADESAAKIMRTGKPLANALKKLESGNKAVPMNDTANSATSSLFIVNPFRGSFIFELFSTHPPIEKRVAKLEAMK